MTIKEFRLALQKLEQARRRVITVKSILDSEIMELIHWNRTSSSYASVHSYLMKALEELMEFDEIWEKYHDE